MDGAQPIFVSCPDLERVKLPWRFQGTAAKDMQAGRDKGRGRVGDSLAYCIQQRPNQSQRFDCLYSSAAFHPNNQKDHYPARSSAFRDGEETYKNEQKRIIRETIRRAFHSPIVSQTSALSIDIALNYFPIISLVT